MGAAIGTLISSSLIGPAHFPVVCRATEYPLPRFLRVGLLPAVGSSLPSAVAMLLVWLLMEPSSGRLLVGFLVGVSAAAWSRFSSLAPGGRCASCAPGSGGQDPSPCGPPGAAGRGTLLGSSAQGAAARATWADHELAGLLRFRPRPAKGALCGRGDPKQGEQDHRLDLLQGDLSEAVEDDRENGDADPESQPLTGGIEPC